VRLLRNILVLIVCVSFMTAAVPVYADQTSELILKLLVKKGVISQKDVDDLKAEVEKVKAAVPDIEDTKMHAKKAGWAEKLKVKGDIRLRNEYQRPGSGGFVNRQRVRARVGVEAKITDTVKGGIALATGGNGAATARSTNQTLSAVFGTKSIDLDKAYIQWNPNKNIKVIGGKYSNPLYRPGDLLWDSDLTFEGASTNVKYSLKDAGIPVDLMAHGGIFVLDDLGNDIKNPFLYTAQVGVGSSVGDIFDWKGYTGYLDFAHIRGSTSANLVPTTGETQDPNTYYWYDHNILEFSGEITFHFLEQMMPSPFAVPLKFFGDYSRNVANPTKDHAYMFGAGLGKKPKKLHDWRAVYNYRFLEPDAFPDEFPDADAFRGRTNGYGHEVIFSYGLAKNVWLEFDWYAFRDKTRGNWPNDKWGHIAQADLNVKF